MSGMAVLLGVTPPLLLVSASPPALASGSLSGVRTTSPVTVTVSGGSGAYTYSWSILDAVNCAVSVSSPTSATTTFLITGVALLNIGTAIARCTITDSVTLQVQSCDVPLSHEHQAPAGA